MFSWCLDSADEELVFKLGRPCAFGLDTNGLHGISGNGGVIGDERCLEVVKGMTVCGKIVGWGDDETGEVVMASPDVDGLEEVGKELINLLQVFVGWGANNGWEFVGCIRDDEPCFLRCYHGTDGEG